MPLDLRPGFRVKGHVPRAPDAGGALVSDRIADRIEVKVWIADQMVVGEGKTVDIELVVHDVSHCLLVRAQQCEVDDFSVARACLSDEEGRTCSGRVHPPEHDPKPLSHGCHDTGVERDHVQVANLDCGRGIDDSLEDATIDVEPPDSDHPLKQPLREPLGVCECGEVPRCGPEFTRHY